MRGFLALSAPRVIFALASSLAATAPARAQMLTPQASQPVKESHRIPIDVFAGEPRGPYQTGTLEELWMDPQRDEVRTSDPADKRHLMVQIWYPASFKGDPPRAPYVLRREIYPPGGLTDWRAWLNDVKDVRTTSVVNAPLAPRAGRFPVLIYQPGNFNPHFSATFQTEFLASHGYVVVAIGRPETFIGKNKPLPGGYYPDGYVYRQDSPPKDEAAFFSLALEDIRFVLDRMQAMNASRGSRFHGRLDLDKVGALGWSQGGYISLMAGRDEPRIKAVANLDGGIGEAILESATRRPILFMHVDWSPWELSREDRRKGQAGLASRLWEMYAQTERWYDVTLKRARHGHFSDRTLFVPADPGEIHPRLAHDIINHYTLEFFDEHLRQSAATPLLTGEKTYPEARLLASPHAAK